MRTDPSQTPTSKIIDSADLNWLDPARVRLTQDAYGRLILREGDREQVEVIPNKLFALTQPDRYISFVDAEGEEIGLLADPSQLDEDSARALAEQMSRRYFIPVIQRVDSIREFWMDQIWSVQTDRGPREFTLQGRNSIRYMTGGGMLLIDTDDNRYLIEDQKRLDETSQDWIDRFVW